MDFGWPSLTLIKDTQKLTQQVIVVHCILSCWRGTFLKGIRRRRTERIPIVPHCRTFVILLTLIKCRRSQDLFPVRCFILCLCVYVFMQCDSIYVPMKICVSPSSQRLSRSATKHSIHEAKLINSANKWFRTLWNVLLSPFSHSFCTPAPLSQHQSDKYIKQIILIHIAHQKHSKVLLTRCIE